ncbi:uncharacterized protein [Epargyreus clarus]|uniref:uncharacterized protein n=1 Tax=Epargyreus clarus TaxID=520877 RepID=UPI003C2BA2DD
MAKEDILLRVEMGKLEIEPSKVNKNIKFINLPQQKKFISTKNFQNNKCACVSLKKNKNMSICKKKHRILKDPKLKLPQTYCKNDYQFTGKEVTPPASNQDLNSESLSLRTLVDNCNQLSISTDGNNRTNTSTQPNETTEWWRCYVLNNKQQQTKDFHSEKGQSSSCSQQALNPPCDVTIDELASYFETLVHIPKKMSSMAEMMYI